MADKQYDIFVLNAHPDDAEMAMGGTLLKLARAGHSILNVSLTKGQAGTLGSGDLRSVEFFKAQEYLGSMGVLLEYPDTRLEVTQEAILAIATLIRKHKPKVVFSPYRKNNAANFDGMHNRDHGVCGEIASQAIKLARLKNAVPEVIPHMVNQLFFYMIPVGMMPNLIFDVSDVREDLIKLISCYESQLSRNELLELLLAIRRTHGAVNRIPYAEAFTTEIPINMTPENIFSF